MHIILVAQGCGKSSRLPVILLEDLEARGQPCRMMVSQPRRIAASSLMKRLRLTLGDKVGMRMGHGIRDEMKNTQIFFVTTGYLVRLVAHCPHVFHDHTHLIIDEVHERSVDGDLLCLLARRLLEEHPNLRLILMSATVHTELYKTYFSRDHYYGDMDVLSVGVRRFPLDIKYVEDLASPKSGMPTLLTNTATKLVDMTSQNGGKMADDVPLELSKHQYNLAFSLIRSVGVMGSGILVFVSGIADIIELTERFEVKMKK
jgi:HrpA-like RNA helicase